MKYYSKVSMSKPTWSRYANVNFSGKVHSVFKTTLNIVTDQGSLLTLTDTTFKTAPNLFRVTNLNLEQLNLVPNMNVIFKNNILLIDQRILVDYSQPLMEKFEVPKFPKLEENNFVKIKQIKQSHWYLEKQNAFQEQAFVREMRSMIKDYIIQLKLVINQDNNAEILNILKKFIGLGIGLTPSGDDFLCGFAYIVSLPNYPNQKLRSILESLEPIIKQQTNIISWQEFLMALQNETRAEIAIATQAIISPFLYEEVKDDLINILTIGSTSGFDILEGILVGFEVLEEVYKEIHNDVKRKNFKKSLHGFSIPDADVK